MPTASSEMSQPEAHHELLLMDSRVAAVHEEHYFDRFRRMDLPYADLLARFRELLGESRWCGGRIVHLGKIVGNEILEFMESDPDVPPGVLLGAAVKALIASAPFLGPLLAPLSAEVECQGFGRLFSGSGYVDKQERRAAVSFKRFATILNINKNLLSSEAPAAGLDVVTFEEPALFELDSSENPFDLDDLEAVSPTATAVVTFLVKIALADGNLGDGEKQMISESIVQMGETLSPSQFERLASMASQEPLENVLAAVANQPVVFKEKMLLLAMLVTAVDGRVELIEKKLLAQSASLLGVTRKRYSEIATDALSLIKARRLAPAERSKPSAGYIPRGAQSQAWLSGSAKPSQGEPQGEGQDAASPPSQVKPVAPSDQARLRNDGASPQLLPSSPTPPLQPAESRDENLRTTGEASSKEGAPRAARPAAAEVAQRPSCQLPPPVPPPGPARIWRCPACRMPQFFEFDECPQCGVIVSKYKERLVRQGESSEPEEFIDVPSDPVEEERPANHSINSHPQVQATPTCPGCRTVVPTGAKFCPSCGTRIA